MITVCVAPERPNRNARVPSNSSVTASVPNNACVSCSTRGPNESCVQPAIVRARQVLQAARSTGRMRACRTAGLQDCRTAGLQDCRIGEIGRHRVPEYGFSPWICAFSPPMRQKHSGFWVKILAKSKHSVHHARSRFSSCAVVVWLGTCNLCSDSSFITLPS